MSTEIEDICLMAAADKKRTITDRRVVLFFKNGTMK